MKTPIQEVIIKIQKLIKDEVDYGGDWEIPFRNSEHILVEKLDYEEKIFKEIFIAGIMLGSGAYQLKKEFDTDEEFKKLYYKMFPEE